MDYKNNILNTLKLYTFKKLIFDFILKKQGAILIELAFILPIFIILIMGVLEFSIIFSTRSAIEDVAREVSRIKLSVSGAQKASASSYGGVTAGVGQDEKYLTYLIHARLVKIVLKPENVTISTTVQSTLFGLPSAATSNPITLNANKTTQPTSFLALGQPKQAVKLKITYKHEYLTPIGAFISALGNELEFSSTIYFQNE